MAIDFDDPQARLRFGQRSAKNDKDARAWLEQIRDFEAKRDAEVGTPWEAIELLARQNVMGGSWDCRSMADAGAIQPADVAEIIETTESDIVGVRPTFAAKAATAQREPLAHVARLLMRTDWEMSPDPFGQGRLAVRDCIAKGQGVVLNDVVADYDAAKRAKMKRDRDARRRLADPSTAALEESIQASIASYEDATPGEDEYADTYLQNRLVQEDMVSTTFVPIESFFRDPYHVREEQWTFMGQKLVLDYDAVMRDENLYVPKDLKPDFEITQSQLEAGGKIAGGLAASPLTIGLGGGGPNGGAGRAMGAGFLRRLITVYKFFALSHDEDGCPTWDLYIVANGAKKPLLYAPAVHDLGCPFSVVQWNERGEVNFPMSDVMKALPHLIEKRDLRSRMFEKMTRSATSTNIFDKADIPTPADLRGVIRGVAANFLGIDNRQNKPLSQIFHELKTAGITQEDLAYLGMLKDDVRAATGKGNNQFQEAMKSDTSASEAMEVSRRADARAAYKANAVHRFFADVAKKRLQLMAQYYDADRVRSMAGPQAAAFWSRQEFTAGNIRHLLISVEKGSMREDNDEAVAQKLMQLLQLGVSFPPFLMTLQVQEMMGEILLRQGFTEGSRFVRQLPPGVLDQLVMTQIMGGPKGSAPAQKNSAQGALPSGGTAA